MTDVTVGAILVDRCEDCPFVDVLEDRCYCCESYGVFSAADEGALLVEREDEERRPGWCPLISMEVTHEANSR